MVDAEPLCPDSCTFAPDDMADIVGSFEPSVTVPSTLSSDLVGINGGDSPGETVGSIDATLSGTDLTLTLTSAVDYCLAGGKYFLSNAEDCNAAYLDADSNFLGPETSPALYTDFAPTTGADGFCLDGASETVDLTSLFPSFKAGDPICVLFFASGIKRVNVLPTSTGDVCTLVDGYSSADNLLPCGATQEGKGKSTKRERNRGRRVEDNMDAAITSTSSVRSLKNASFRLKGGRSRSYKNKHTSYYTKPEPQEEPSSGDVLQEKTFRESWYGFDHATVRGLQAVVVVEDCPAYFVLQEQTFSGAGGRFRDFDSASGGQRIFVGSGDLGNSNCRATDASASYIFGEAMTFSVTYNSIGNSLVASVDSSAGVSLGTRATDDLDDYRNAATSCVSPVSSNWNVIKLTLSARPGDKSGRVVVTNLKLTKSNGEVVTLGNNFCEESTIDDIYWYLGDMGDIFTTGTSKIEATVILCDNPADYGNSENSKIQLEFGTMVPVGTP